jgi:hypothetical protein
VGVAKLEVRVATLELAPQSPYAEISLAHIDVVKEDDGTRGEFLPPRLQVVRDGLIRVITVHVQQIDTGIGKVLDGIVECGTNQTRKGPVAGVVMSGQFLEDFFAVISGVGITPPGVYGEAGRAQSEPVDSLGEREVRVAGVRPQFHKSPRSERIDDPEGEGNVARPRIGLGEMIHRPERGVPEDESGRRTGEGQHQQLASSWSARDARNNT